jgi:hypothetical protein
MQSGPDERSIPGNTVAVQADMPFNGLTTFGTAFLSKFECSQMPHPVSFYRKQIYTYVQLYFHQCCVITLFSIYLQILSGEMQ